MGIARKRRNNRLEISTDDRASARGLYLWYTEGMALSRKMTLGVVVAPVLLFGVLALWHEQRSQTATVFENPDSEQITKDQELPEKRDTLAAGITKGPMTKSVVEEKKSQTKETVSPTKSEEEIGPKGFALKENFVPFGHENTGGRKIDTIVLHSSYSPTGDPYSVSAVIGIWKSYGVSPHYMIARDGTIYQLVSDSGIAYHAGESEMQDGRKNVNDFSIGVEILNTKDDEYTKAQYQAVKDLIGYLKGKYSIKYVVGHDDIAPGRKTDPWNFDWNKL